MSVLWLTPLAWIGVVLAGVPILIHLLARQRSRRVLFPSLKFVPAAQLVALRRHVVADWPLLIVRMLIVVCAVTALAGPVLVSNARRAQWDTRVARAVVVTHDAADVSALADEERQTTFVSAQFSAPTLPDAIRSAADWLSHQPPAARELVVIGDFRERSLSARDLDVVGPHVGIRFLPIERTDDESSVEMLAMADSSARTAQPSRVRVTPELTRTEAQYTPAVSAPSLPVRVVAATAEQPYADALLRAVLRDGVMFGTDGNRAITLLFDGALYEDEKRIVTPTHAWMRHVLEQHPDIRGGAVDSTLVARAAMKVGDDRAIATVASVLRSAFAPSLDHIEPRRISAATLAEWSRPPTAAPAMVLPGDEGDRRWFWAAALLLLGIEQVVRRRRRVV